MWFLSNLQPSYTLLLETQCSSFDTIRNLRWIRQTLSWKAIVSRLLAFKPIIHVQFKLASIKICRVHSNVLNFQGPSCFLLLKAQSQGCPSLRCCARPTQTYLFVYSDNNNLNHHHMFVAVWFFVPPQIRRYNILHVKCNNNVLCLAYKSHISSAFECAFSVWVMAVGFYS